MAVTSRCEKVFRQAVEPYRAAFKVLSVCAKRRNTTETTERNSKWMKRLTWRRVSILRLNFEIFLFLVSEERAVPSSRTASIDCFHLLPPSSSLLLLRCVSLASPSVRPSVLTVSHTEEPTLAQAAQATEAARLGRLADLLSVPGSAKPATCSLLRCCWCSAAACKSDTKEQKDTWEGWICNVED